MTSEDFYQQRNVLIEYMKTKMHDGDWHAVSDVANDLRVLEAEYKIKRQLLPFKMAYESLAVTHTVKRK